MGGPAGLVGEKTTHRDAERYTSISADTTLYTGGAKLPYLGVSNAAHRDMLVGVHKQNCMLATPERLDVFTCIVQRARAALNLSPLLYEIRKSKRDRRILGP